MPASPYSRVYPTTDRIEFDGGLNSKFQKNLIQDNESPDCLNVIFNDRAVETRGGTSKFNSTTVGAYKFDGLYTRHDQAGNQTMIAWHAGTAYTAGTNTFVTIPSAQSVYTAGQRVGAVEYENHIFFGNGGASVVPYKYNGTDFTRHGAYPPTTTATVATAPTGTGLTNSYIYKVTFVNSALVESDVGPVTTTIAVSNQNVRLTAIPTGAQSWGVGQRRIYRATATVAGATFYRIATLSDNTTTQYDDAIADSAATVAAPTDQGVPPLWTTAVYHKDRLFMNDPTQLNLVWFTELANPYVVKATSFIRAGDNTGEIVRGFGVHDDGVLVFCDNSTWLIYMESTSSDDWRVIRVKSPYGSRSPFGEFNYDNKFMHPAVQNGKFVGFAAVEGATVAPNITLLTAAAAGSTLQSEPIEPDMFLVQNTYISNISSMVFKNKAYIAVTYGTNQTANNRVYLFDFSYSNLSDRNRAAWVPWTGITATQFTIYNEKLYYADSGITGFVHEMNTSNYNDNGSAINSYFWSKEFSGIPGEEGYWKDYRYANILFARLGSYNMNLGYRIDSDSSDGNNSVIDLTSGGSLWGSMVWGVDNWNAGAESKEIRQTLGQLSGKRIQFKFSNQNTANQGFKVYGLNFIYNRKSRR